MAQCLKTGDKVAVIAGNYKGKTALIIKVDRNQSQAFLEGINLRERHLKKTQFNPKGGKKSVHVGIDFSNLKLIEAKKPLKKTKLTSKKGAK